MKPLLKKASNLVASYRLSCILFLFLLILTYLGTMHQVENGLYQSQKKYFESIFLVHWAFGSVPVPLPGGYLVMALTFVNLFWSTVVRFRLSLARIGMLIAHVGILVLLVGAAVSYTYAVSGHMILYEGETSNEIESSDEWEIGLSEAASSGTVTEHIIVQKDFETLTENKSRLFKFSGLPFDLRIEGYAPNAAPVGMAGGGAAAAGLSKQIKSVPLDREQEQNMAGANVTAIGKQPNETVQDIVWAGNAAPTVLTVAGKQWNLSLRKRRWQLPFTIRLDKFVHELHPRTNMAREYSSHVTKIEGDASQEVKITMNEPLRHFGYTFYQSSWGPQNGGQDQKLYSVFSVVKNPTDQWPLYSCVITTVGLVIHFLQKLLSYLKLEKGRRS